MKFFGIIDTDLVIFMQQRIINLNGQTFPRKRFYGNQINNQKYNILTFIPKVLLNQFKQFFNLFFLAICLSQFFSILRVGFLITYLFPLIFVLSITYIKEGYDDYKRYKRDKELNYSLYQKLNPDQTFKTVFSKDIKVGNIIKVSAGQRIPADMILLHTTEKSGSVFLKTDQLDGETDWKLRKAVAFTQKLKDPTIMSSLQSSVTIESPQKDIYKFAGTFQAINELEEIKEPLNLENTLWASTLLTTGSSLGLVIYTGKDTRIEMNAKAPRNKLGRIDHEIDYMSFALFIFMVCVAFLLQSF